MFEVNRFRELAVEDFPLMAEVDWVASGRMVAGPENGGISATMNLSGSLGRPKHDPWTVVCIGDT